MYAINLQLNLKANVCLLTVWCRVGPSSIFGAHHAGFTDQLMFFAARKLHDGSDNMTSWRRIFNQETVRRNDRRWTQNF